MREIVLDIQPFEDKATLHQYLKEQLHFSFYYGASLDALYEELTSITDATMLTLRFPSQPYGAMAAYLPRLLTAIKGAAKENYNLSVRFEEV